MNSERIPLPLWAGNPIPTVQAQVYQSFLPQQMPIAYVPNTRNTVEDLITLRRADLAKSIIEGQVDRQVAGMLIETPKFLNLHQSNPTLHDSNKGRR